jgi:hypothetical protein
MKLYERLAQAIDGWHSCQRLIEAPSATCEDVARFSSHKIRYSGIIRDLVYEHMPQGEGIDQGVELDFSKSTAERLVFTFGFRRRGYKLIVTSSLAYGLMLKITGPDTNSAKAHIREVFEHALKVVP